MSYKNIFKWIFLSFLFFFSFSQIFSLDSIFTTENWELPYCDNDECGYQPWVDLIKDKVDNVETTKNLSEYVQDVVVYLLTFISIIAVVYIIYAWFKIMIWWWNEEELKKSRKTILHVIIWIVIIWLSYSIVSFILDILSSGSV